ncbi:MAG: WD40 repeat domain-containing protein [Bacteroidales bacterium]|nr:WD40 repeat domain-containing protein [Bacteroidales bacterium]
MKNTLFYGLEAYRQGDLLPERSDEIRRLLAMLDRNSANILRSAPKTGKTSLVNVATSPENLQRRNAMSVRFDIPKFKFGDKVLEKQLVAIINSLCDKPTYLDLVFEDDGSLWYSLKKLQANFKDIKSFYFIFDNFDNYFTYGEAARREFAASLSKISKGDVPKKISEKLQEIMMGESQVPLPQDAVMSLIEPPKVSLLFVIENSTFPLLSNLCDNLPDIFKNTMELMPFDVETAKKAVPFIAAEAHEGLSPMTVEPAAVEYIVSHFASSGGIVNPGLLRNAILYIRQEAKSFDNLTLPMVEISEFFRVSYFDEAMDSIENDSRRDSIVEFVKGEMVVEGESQPLPAYRGKALSKYGVGEGDLDFMVEHYVFNSKITDDGRTYYLPFNGDIFGRLKGMECGRLVRQTIIQPQATPLVNLPQARPSVNLPQAVSTASQPQARPPALQTQAQSSRVMMVTLAVVTLVSLATVLLAFSLKGDAERNANAAKSNMLSAFAFQKLESDPTFSLRLAQQAISLDSCNMQAYSALLNSFYNTDIFYNISARIDGNIVKAEVSDNGGYIMTYVKDDINERYAARILYENGDMLVEIPHKHEVTSVTMSSDYQKILTTSDDSTARVFDLNGHELMALRGHKAIIWTADFSPDGKKILTAGSDFNVMVWDSLGNEISTLRGHDFDVYCAKFSPDGSKILSSSGDNTARLWSIDGKECKVLTIREDADFSKSLVNQAVFSPDGKYILLAANDYLNKNHRARLWDLDGNELINFGGHEDWINSVGFSSDGQHIITSSRDKIVRVFALSGALEKELKGHNSNVWSASYKPDNQTIVTVSDDHTIRTWSIGKRFETYEKAKNVSFAGFSPNGLNIIVVQDSTAQSWDLTGEVVATFKGHHSYINSARFSPDGTMVLTACKDGTARLWKADGTLQTAFDEHKATVNDAIFTCDGANVISVSDDSTVIIHNLKTNAVNVIRGKYGITAVCPSPEPNVFAIGDANGDISVCEVSGKVLRTFHGHDARVNSVAFSYDGKFIVTSSSDETAGLWDNLGQRHYTFRGYENKVNSAVFSPDGKFILTTSDDGNANLWAMDGRDIMSFKHDGMVKDAVFSPDGKYMLSVFRNDAGLKTLKLRMLTPDGITKHIDQLDLYGTVWQPDEETMKKYGIGEE